MKLLTFRGTAADRDAPGWFADFRALLDRHPDEELTRFEVGLPVVVANDVDVALARRLGVDVVTLASPPATVGAPEDAGLAKARQRIRASLGPSADEVFGMLRGPALQLDVDHVSHALGVSFPPDVLGWLSLHDGDTYPHPFHWELGTLASALSTWQMLQRTLGPMEPPVVRVRADPEVAPVWWHAKWLPLLHDGAGDALCIDFAPTAAGRVGQIVEFRHDDDLRPCVAPSLTAWLDGLAAQLEDGRMVVLEDERGHFAGLIPRDNLTGGLAGVRLRGEPEAARVERVRTYYETHPESLIQAVLQRLRRDGLVQGDPFRIGFFVPQRLRDHVAGGPPAIWRELPNDPDVTVVGLTLAQLEAAWADVVGGR